jgi:hypothetical protein
MAMAWRDVKYPATVAEHAEAWKQEIEARDPSPHVRYALPGHSVFRYDDRGQRVVDQVPGVGDAPKLAGPGALDPPLSPDEISFIKRAGMGCVLELTDANIAHLEVDRLLFIRLVMHMTEGAFTHLVIGLAQAEGILVHHCEKAATCQGGPGFPDLVLAGRACVAFAELKRPYGQVGADAGWGALSDSQLLWAERLKGCGGIKYGLWTPVDLPAIPAALAKLNG